MSGRTAGVLPLGTRIRDGLRGICDRAVGRHDAFTEWMINLRLFFVRTELATAALQHRTKAMLMMMVFGMSKLYINQWTRNRMMSNTR